VFVVSMSTPAVAAMWMQISINPSAPIAGESVSVSVMTFSATQSLCWDDPRITPIPEATWYSGGTSPTSLDLQLVVLNSSQRFTVSLVQRPTNGAYWDGTIVFPVGGEWQLYAKRAGAPPNPASTDRCVGLVRTVEVQPLAPAASPKAGSTTAVAHAAGIARPLVLGAIVLVVAGAFGLGAAAIARLRRRYKS
jgi:hypothetical protein